LRQADQARTDFAAIEPELEVIQRELARLPTRRKLAETALGIIFATMIVTAPRVRLGVETGHTFAYQGEAIVLGEIIVARYRTFSTLVWPRIAALAVVGVLSSGYMANCPFDRANLLLYMR
jgi:hypothetical protein